MLKGGEMTRAFEINANSARIVMARIARRLMVPLAFAASTLPVTQTLAQDAFPAPLPGQPGAPASSHSVPFPPANAELPSVVCMKGFAALREEAVARGGLIKAAGARHAGPNVACKLIANFAQSEIKMIEYVEANSANCGIPPDIGDRIRAAHKNTDAMRTKVCNLAQQARGVFEPPGPVGDFPQLDRR
jgi:hypothetical protein